MKVCFNEATTLENSNLAQDLEYCEKHGYDGIEIRTMDKLPEYLASHSIQDLQNFFATHHLKPLALNALVFFNNRDDAGHQQMLAEFREMVAVAAAIGAPYVVAVPLVTDQKILKDAIHRSAVDVLRQLSLVAVPSGVRIAVEFIGHPQCTVNTFGQCYDIIQSVARDNVGMVVDCFHFHAMGSRLEDLQAARGEKIFILHMDDAENYPIGILRDEDRVWPGLGVIDLDGIVSTLRDIGYAGAASVELFRPEYYRLPPEDAVITGKKTVLDVIAPYYPVG